jgi:hypothetical protein
MNLKKIGISAVTAALISLSSVNSFAVEYGGSDNQVVIDNNPAFVVEQEFQEKQSAVVRASRQESISAGEMAQNYLDAKGKSTGWNPQKGTLLVVEQSIRDMNDDPAYNGNFMNIRNMAAIEAVLRAKVAAIKSIRSEMSAADILVGPGSNLDEQLSKDLKNARAKFEAQKRKLEKLLKEENIAYQDVQDGVTFKDRFNSFFDAVIKKLDAKYDSEKIEAKKRKKYEKIKQRVAEANEIYTKSEQKLKALEGTIKQEQTSVREILSKMPLFGATVVEQFESYNEDEERYENAVIMLWSPKAEEASRAMLTGKDLIVPPGNKSLQQYLQGNKDAWLTTTGGRRFRDSNGDVYYLGVGSEEIGNSASADRRAISMAKIEAQTQVAFALFADVKTQERLERKEQIRNGGQSKDFTQSVKSMSEELSQSFKNLQLQGASQVFQTRGIHPLSGKKIYVSVFAISAKAAKAAIKAEASSYASKHLLIDSQQKSKARKDAMDDSVKRHEQDKSAYNKEYNKKTNEIEKENRQNVEKYTQEPEKTYQPKQHSTQQIQPTKSSSGSHAGASSGDGFDW